MLPWLLRKIGLADDFVDHLGETVFGFQYPAVFWVGLGLLVPIGWFIARRQRQNLGSAPPALKAALTVTRVLVLLLLVVVLAGPFLEFDYQFEKRPLVAILFDHSQSMNLPAGPFEDEKELVAVAEAAGYATGGGRLDPEARKALNRISRARLAQTAVQNAAKTLHERLTKRHDVRYYGFARELTRIEVDAGAFRLPDPPEPGGPATCAGDAVAKLLEEAAGRPIAGFVLLSDGENTAGRSTAEVAPAAKALGVPVHAVPIGSAVRLRDIAIVDVFTAGLVAVGDTVRVAVTLESQGFDKRPVKVELLEGTKVLDTKELILRGSEQQQLELSFQAKEAGDRYLTVRVPPQPEEPKELHGNNADLAFVRVSEERLRVLHVDGTPRWDFRFLKNAMRRDHGLGGRQGKEPDILLEAEWRRRPAGLRGEALPSSVKELAEYHAVILGDASPELLEPSFLTALAEAVREHGVGLVIASGPRFMPHAYGASLLDLLPVKMRPGAAGLDVSKAFRLELTPEGGLHESMRFYDDNARNANGWAQLPPYHWCAAVERAAPGASVLAVNPGVENRHGKLPVVAVQHAGKGRVLFLGTDSTFLWRQNVGDRFFYKFWGQGLRYIARRDDGGGKKNRIEARPLRTQPGELAEVELYAVGPDGLPRTEPMQTVQLVGGGGAQALQLQAHGGPGRYVGRFTPTEPGEYTAAYAPAGAERVEAKLRVLAGGEEFRNPNVNRPALQQFAAASGGEVVELAQLGDIPDKLKAESESGRRHQRASLWDNWLTLGVLIFIYSLDVGLRRLAGLS